jgi:dihydropteroate synthase
MIKTKLVAILNITPDSFSDGGLYFNPQAISKQINAIIASRAEIIDIGAVSTRPNGAIVSTEEEIARFDMLIPIIKPILAKTDIKISIDSHNFETLEYVLEKLPVAWINDQSGAIDDRIIKLVKRANLKIAIMHNMGLPVDPSKHIPDHIDVVNFVKNWLCEKAEYLLEQGIKKEQIILDPGIGFGKNAEQSWQLIKESKNFADLGYEVMYGHSRKSFMNLITDKAFAERDLDTSIISFYLINQGIDYLRVHNIEENNTAIKIAEKLI